MRHTVVATATTPSIVSAYMVKRAHGSYHGLTKSGNGPLSGCDQFGSPMLPMANIVSITTMRKTITAPIVRRAA